MAKGHKIRYQKWSDGPQEIETAIFTKHLLKNKFLTLKKNENAGTSQRLDSIWFCSLFQRNKYPHKSTNMQVIKGKTENGNTYVCHMLAKRQE